jgi:uncharacterized integral membrane protein
LRKLLTAIVVIPVAALLLIFALANRTPATLSLDPFSPGDPAFSIELPLFLVIILSLMVGVVLGSVANWISQAHWRREARHSRSELRRLEQEASDLRRAQVPASANLPAPYMGERG